MWARNLQNRLQIIYWGLFRTQWCIAQIKYKSVSQSVCPPFFFWGGGGLENEFYSLSSLQFHSPSSKHVMLLGKTEKVSARTHCERPRFTSRDGLRSSVKCLQLLTYIVLPPIVMEGHVRGSAACQGVSPGDIPGNTRRSNYIVCNMLIGHSHSSGAGSPALVKLWLRIKRDWGKAAADVYYCRIEWLLVLQSWPKSGRF